MPEEARGQLMRRDLVVAAAAICVLGFLLLQFVGVGGGSRAAGPRNTCFNNQHQLALGSLQYAEAHRHFPGYANRVGRWRTSFVVSLFPYMERNDLYAIYTDSNKSLDEAAVLINVLQCPQAQKTDGTPLSYVINAGQADMPDELPQEDVSARLAASGIATDLTVKNPTMISPADVNDHDGTTYTLLFSENLQAESWSHRNAAELHRWTTFLWWNRPPKIKPATFKINVGKATAPRPTYDLLYSRPSSNHAGGVVMSFCDGHNRFVSQDIDYHVYKQLMTPFGNGSLDTVNRRLEEGDY